MRLALIGCGERTRTLVPHMLGGPVAVHISALADPDPSAIRQVRSLLESLGVSGARQAQEAADHRTLRPDGVDACLIASPHSFHYKQAEHWLSLNKLVFVEKPLACRYREADALVRRYSGTALAVGDERRFRPDLLKLRGLIESGAVGRILSVRYEDNMLMRPHFSSSWRNDIGLSGGGVILDLGCHVFSTLARLCGPPSHSLRVERAHLFGGAHEVETGAFVSLGDGAGMNAAVVLRLVQSPALNYEAVTVTGDGGVIRMFRRRGPRSWSQLEVTSGGRRCVARVRNGGGFDSRGVRRFLRDPAEASDSVGGHLAALRLISQAYEVADYGRERTRVGRGATELVL